MHRTVYESRGRADFGRPLLHEWQNSGYKPEPKWVGANSSGSDSGGGRQAPSYYIYDETFTLECTAGAEIEGTMWANNAAGAFLNGHPIGYQNYKQDDSYRGNAGDFVQGYESPTNGWPFGEEWGERGKPYTTSYGPPAKYEVPQSDFLAGVNTLQFVVQDGGPEESSSAAGLEFAAKIKSHPCVPWLSNGKPLPEGKKAQTYSWGTLTFSSAGVEEVSRTGRSPARSRMLAMSGTKAGTATMTPCCSTL